MVIGEEYTLYITTNDGLSPEVYDQMDFTYQGETDLLFLLPDPICGNEIIETGESCDDGNEIDDDDCSNSCNINIQEIVTPPS